MSTPRQSITVSRDYQNFPGECARALELLLKKPVIKAAEPAPEPDGRDDTKELKNDGAITTNYR